MGSISSHGPMNGLNILPSYTDYFHLNTATLSLNTAALWIGGAIAGLTYGQVTDIIGRRYTLFWAAVGTLLSVILQTAAQNTAMFVIARILVGYGTSASTLTGPTYVAETLPYNWRAWGLGVLNDCYYVGGLIAAGVTYRTATYNSTWAWRVPSLVQGIFSILCIAILPFVPESPRWLAYVGRTEEAYYLGTMLENAGITDTTTQLQINIILNAWCLCCALVGTYYADKLGRRPTAIISTSLLTVFLFIVGALTKVYGTSTNKSGVYGTVAAIFLFQGAYSFGWTPLLYLYPPEVLNYPIRANGMGLFTFVLNGVALLIVFSFPFAQEAMGWKIYMMNGAWDVLEVGLIWKYWVETKGKTLEEIDELFEGTKHSDAPDLERIVQAEMQPEEVVSDSIEVVVSRKSV
ncbi:hexose transporter [Botrytis cinerea]